MIVNLFNKYNSKEIEQPTCNTSLHVVGVLNIKRVIKFSKTKKESNFRMLIKGSRLVFIMLTTT